MRLNWKIHISTSILLITITLNEFGILITRYSVLVWDINVRCTYERTTFATLDAYKYLSKINYGFLKAGCPYNNAK